MKIKMSKIIKCQKKTLILFKNLIIIIINLKKKIEIDFQK